MPGLSENLQIDVDAPRCPQCGRRVTIEATTCDTCGYHLIPHRERAPCKRCGRRIPADAVTCPRCGADRSDEIPPDDESGPVLHVARAGLYTFLTLLLLCCGWVIFRAFATNTLARALGLVEASPTPTQFVNTVFSVAATPAPSSTAPATPTPSAAATASPTPTRRGERKSPAPAGPTLPAGFYAAPALTAPANATVFQGANSSITLQWLPVAANGLGDNEWYFVSVTFTASDGSPGSHSGWSKETHWDVPSNWWNEAAGDARTFKWTVSVMRVDGVDPTTSSHTLASPNSTPRSFIWN